jgi:hypothetical protein
MAGCSFNEHKFTHDPIENDPQYKGVFLKIDVEVKKKLEGHPMQGKLGYCHIFWETKKKILKEKYGIDWKSPAEMNPDVFFD